MFCVDNFVEIEVVDYEPILNMVSAWRAYQRETMVYSAYCLSS